MNHKEKCKTKRKADDAESSNKAKDHLSYTNLLSTGSHNSKQFNHFVFFFLFTNQNLDSLKISLFKDNDYSTFTFFPTHSTIILSNGLNKTKNCLFFLLVISLLKNSCNVSVNILPRHRNSSYLMSACGR